MVALVDLGAQRIGHGIRALDDPRLLDHLAEHRVPLEVCPTSNVRTGAVRGLEDHPLRRLLAAGVGVTLATDDPGVFGCDLVGEYRLAHEWFGLTRDDLLQVARTGTECALCPPATRTALLAELDAVE